MWKLWGSWPEGDRVRIALIGHGPIAAHVAAHLPVGVQLIGALCRPGRDQAARAALGVPVAQALQGLPGRPDLLVDCAGHSGLRAHGVAALGAGVEVLTVSVGALADAVFCAELEAAARAGGTRLCLASGAIGALDALAAAAMGTGLQVTYTGRKPPQGWRGSRAEKVLDLDALTAPATHFTGTARAAAQAYPKNANVAAAVALAGAGLDATRAELIADPGATANIHEIAAEGAFGRFRFQIEGLPLPGNPRSSALTALSLLAALRQRGAAIRLSL